METSLLNDHELSVFSLSQTPQREDTFDYRSLKQPLSVKRPDFMLMLSRSWNGRSSHRARIRIPLFKSERHLCQGIVTDRENILRVSKPTMKGSQIDKCICSMYE
jgi:hypothetical protein